MDKIDFQRKLKFMVVDPEGDMGERIESFFKAFVDQHAVYRAFDNRQIRRIGKQKNIDVLLINASQYSQQLTVEDLKEFKAQIKPSLKICLIKDIASQEISQELLEASDHVFSLDDLSFFKLIQIALASKDEEEKLEKGEQPKVQAPKKFSELLDQVNEMLKDPGVGGT